MSITKTMVDKVFDDTVAEPVLRPEEIPSIDLYMDQALSLFGNIRADDSAPLTKAMINNYSKDGLLMPVKGKKYSKEQLIRILMIYYMKPALPIQAIKRVLATLDESDDTVGVYSRFLAIKEAQGKTLPGVANAILPVEEELTDEEAALLVMALCSLSGQLKIAAERLVESCFAQPEKGTKKK